MTNEAKRMKWPIASQFICSRKSIPAPTKLKQPPAMPEVISTKSDDSRQNVFAAHLRARSNRIRSDTEAMLFLDTNAFR
jgi:hypothetical protein